MTASHQHSTSSGLYDIRYRNMCALFYLENTKPLKIQKLKYSWNWLTGAEI